jgi:hypothetical protein
MHPNAGNIRFGTGNVRPGMDNMNPERSFRPERQAPPDGVPFRGKRPERTDNM